MISDDGIRRGQHGLPPFLGRNKDEASPNAFGIPRLNLPGAVPMPNTGMNNGC